MKKLKESEFDSQTTAKSIVNREVYQWVVREVLGRANEVLGVMRETFLQNEEDSGRKVRLSCDL